MKRFIIPLCMFSTVSFADATALEEVIVEADFFQRGKLDTSFSLSVLGAEQIQGRKATHIEDVLNVIPNVNFASGASRGRFFQIRGIGERSQFVDPINPSVGLVIDGIDFTGVGGAATTLDIKQVEVLRGPQGTLYGANALAGLINIVSRDPAAAGGELRLTVGEFNTRELSQVISGPVTENVAMRFALAKNLSDGYIKNAYLERENTNNIDETTLRGKLHWQLDDRALIKFTAYLVDADNGYDAFSLDNTRTTLSDQPGHDRINTKAASMQLGYSGFEMFNWETLLSGADSDTEYGYDEDWSYRNICAINAECAFFQYSTTDNYQRVNRNVTFDTRLVSAANSDAFSWVAGLYYRTQDVELLRTYTDNDPDLDSFYGPITNRQISLFSSGYATDNYAAYGQLQLPLTDSLALVVGARRERRKAEYDDSNNRFLHSEEDLWGGKLALEHRALEGQLFYALVSRGYKAGGNNIPGPQDANGEDLIPLLFATEFMWNYEVGHKASWRDGEIAWQSSFFYQDRDDIQIKQSLVASRDTGEINGDCPCDFTDFIGNAASGINYGLELELSAALGEKVLTWASIGWLRTEYRDFLSFSHVDADAETGTAVDLDGRDQAHAPNYQAALGVNMNLSPWLDWRIDVEYKDEFFLSPRHDVKTQAYTLLNSRLTYHHDSWEIALWGKNLSDKETIVRGFGGFGNDPRKFYATEAYFQYGAPRVVGVSARLEFR